MAREVHRVIGFSIAGCWALLLVTGLTVAVRKRGAGRLYWGLLGLLEVTLALRSYQTTYSSPSQRPST